MSRNLSTLLWAHGGAECNYLATAFLYACVSFSVFLTFQGVEVTQLYTTIIKPRGTLWLASLKVTSAARAIALSATHILTGAPRQTRLILLESSSDPVSVTICPLLLPIFCNRGSSLSPVFFKCTGLVFPYSVCILSCLCK